MAPAANSVSIRGALVLVLLVASAVSTAEATRNVAAAPIGSVHPAFFVDCVMECATQSARCGFSCLNKPLLEGPHCTMACFEANVKCSMECGRASAFGPTPPHA